MVKSIFKRIINSLIKTILFKIPNRVKDYVLKELLANIGTISMSTQNFNSMLLKHETTTDDYLTYSTRPKYSKDMELWSDLSIEENDNIAIIIQGPLVHEDNFTLETIKIYRKLHSSVLIILSTWADEDTESFKCLNDDNLVILKNEKPSHPGFHNINMQTTSTYTGIQKAKQMGKEYVLKTRTDQRMYATNIFNYFLSLIKSFPLDQGINQKCRILACSYFSRKYILYSVSDMLMFGHVEDMLKFWDRMMCTDDFSEFEIDPNKAKVINNASVQSYLVKRYLNRIGLDADNSIGDSWKVYARLFCIVDKETLDFYWYQKNPSTDSDLAYRKEDPKKYRNRELGRIIERKMHSYLPKKSQIITHKDWLILYNNRNKGYETPEYILEERTRSLLNKNDYYDRLN